MSKMSKVQPEPREPELVPNPASQKNLHKPLRFLDRMAADSARRSSAAEARSSQWASIRQSEWAATQKRNGVRPTRQALREFNARQQADISRRHEKKVAVLAAESAPLDDPNAFFVARRVALRHPPRFQATGRTLEPGESVMTGERRVYGRQIFAETDRGWIAVRRLTASELRAAAVRQAAAMTTELLAGDHGDFAAVTPVAQLLRGVGRPSLESVADAAVLAWQELGDASPTANSRQLIGLPRPPEVSDIGQLRRWLVALGESLTSAVRAGLPYALLGERLPADHKLFKQRQWTSDDLNASRSQLQHSFRKQLTRAVANGSTGDASDLRNKSAKLDTSAKASIGGYDDYGDEGFEDDDDDIDVQEAADTSAQAGTQAKSCQAANFFSRLERGAIGRVERPPEQSVHRPLAIVDQQSRSEEVFSPVIGPSWRKHQLSWDRWAMSADVVARMDRDSKDRHDRDRRQKAAAAAVEAAECNTAALSARAEFVCAEQQFYIRRKDVASTWNRQMRVRVETAPVASGPSSSLVVAIDPSQTVAEVAASAASQMRLRSPSRAAIEHDAITDNPAVWTLARGVEVLDPRCTVVQCGVLPQTTLALVPAGTKNGGSLRSDFSPVRRAHDAWLRKQQSRDEAWKQRAQQRPRRNSAPQLATASAALNPAVFRNTKMPQKVRSFLSRVADDAERRKQAAVSRQQSASLEAVKRSMIGTCAASSFCRKPSSVTAVSPRLTKAARLRADAIEAAANAASNAARKFSHPAGGRRAFSAPRERPTCAKISAARSSAASALVRSNRAAQLRSVSGAERRKAPARVATDADSDQQTDGKSWQDQALVEEYGGPLLAH